MYIQVTANFSSWIILNRTGGEGICSRSPTKFSQNNKFDFYTSREIKGQTKFKQNMLSQLKIKLQTYFGWKQYQNFTIFIADK